MRQPLYKTLLLNMLAVIVISFLCAAIIGDTLGAKWVVKQRTASLEQLGRVMLPQARDGFGPPAPNSESQAVARRLGSLGNCRVTLISNDGVVIGDSERNSESLPLMESHRNRPEFIQAVDEGLGFGFRYSRTLKKDFLYVAFRVEKEGRSAGVFRLAISLTELEQLRGSMRQAAFVSLGLGLLFAVLLSLWFSRRLTRPIAHMTQVARRMAEGDLDEEIRTSEIEEVAELGITLNGMARSLRGHMDSLLAEKNQATAIVQSMAEGVVALDEIGRVLMINPAAAQMFDVAVARPRGLPLVEVIRQHEMNELVEQVQLKKKTARRDIHVYQPVERVLTAQAVLTGSFGPGDPHTVIVIQDLTEQQRYERLRREFVANVSHELRTPLTSIRGLAETLEEGALEDPKNNRRFLGIIREESSRLERLIEDLLQLARIESQEAAFKTQEVDLEKLVLGLAKTFQSELKKRSQKLQIELGNLPPVQGDPRRLEQVFINLMDNAIKYNKDCGEIRISAQKADGKLRISVQDTGIGIPEEDLPRIFERFYRVDKARSRELGGTGLGLSIVKHIVEEHGGEVSVTSELSKGSVFLITLRLAAG
ncbi:MAG: HAMP domain-containing protein [Candidatus Omnitrophica bacterium]|nr:HAMP domain-containing protein [Candidatus Omnitrophota bacterium]